jgi:2,4-dienoyl-CoA reductase-like NADH-dependent reductase (Old Yellow Enzyme family)
VVHEVSPHCKIIAQVSADLPGLAPSAIESPYSTEKPRQLSIDEIDQIVECIAKAITWLQDEGFDGVQLHAAHGGLLSCFLSPYANRRRDQYGGSARNRARIIQQIVSTARTRVGGYPILIKMNCTDFLEDGIDEENLEPLALAVEAAGIDAIEVSGGHWDCLTRSEDELGFWPVPAPESHTRLKRPEKQSYFLKYAERLSLGIPLILVGGNRDVDRLEAILRQGKVDFIAFCRPLISEPDLPMRWLEGRGRSGTDCISCNSCIFEMYTSLDKGAPRLVRCLMKEDRSQVAIAQKWLSTWVDTYVLRRE